MSFSVLKSTAECHKFRHLETKYFLPDDDDFKEAPDDAYVQGVSRTVYMITCIKIERVASVSSDKEKEVAGDMKVGVDLTTTLAFPVTLGPKLSWENKDERTVSMRNLTNYIFGYRLKKPKAKKSGGFMEKNYVEGTLFGRDEEGDSISKSAREMYDIEELDAEGEGIPDMLEEIVALDARG
jgi:uncharacterized protein YbaR (Trm112 family)